MNMLRYVFEYIQGGWGIEGNTRRTATRSRCTVTG